MRAEWLAKSRRAWYCFYMFCFATLNIEEVQYEKSSLMNDDASKLMIRWWIFTDISRVCLSHLTKIELLKRRLVIKSKFLISFRWWRRPANNPIAVVFNIKAFAQTRILAASTTIDKRYNENIEKYKGSVNDSLKAKKDKGLFWGWAFDRGISLYLRQNVIVAVRNYARRRFDTRQFIYLKSKYLCPWNF